MTTQADTYISEITTKAEAGDAKAQTRLGSLHKAGVLVTRDYSKAMEWHTKAAEQGYAEAQHNLAMLYTYWETGKANHAKAVEWFTKAAEQGYPPSQNSLGVIHHFGKNTKKDYEQAFEWYEKAARQGHLPAITNMKSLFRDLVRESANDMDLVGNFEKSATGQTGDNIILAAKIAACLKEIEPAGKSVVAAPSNDKI